TYYTNRDFTLRLWETATGREIDALRLDACSVAFSPDGRRVAIGRGTGEITVRDVAGKRNLFNLSGHPSDVLSVVFSPDGKLLASGGFDHTVRLWDLERQRELVTLGTFPPVT